MTDEGRFDSTGEYQRWLQLKLLAAAGEITQLERQIAYPFVYEGKPIFRYYADFRYCNRASGQVVVEDFKKYKTEIYRLKKKLIEAQYGFQILESGYETRKRAKPKKRASRTKNK